MSGIRRNVWRQQILWLVCYATIKPCQSAKVNLVSPGCKVCVRIGVFVLVRTALREPLGVPLAS